MLYSNNVKDYFDRYDLLKMCWDQDPKKRPTFGHLITFFANLLESSSVSGGMWLGLRFVGNLLHWLPLRQREDLLLLAYTCTNHYPESG